MRVRAAIVVVLLGALGTAAPGEASSYGTGRFRAVQIRFESADVVALIEGYVGEGGNAVLDPSDPYFGYEYSSVCATVYTSSGTDQGCGEGSVSIAWPLLEAAAITARAGPIDIDLVVVERGLPRPSPMLEFGFPVPFVHGGVLTYRPGHATGTVRAPHGAVSGVTDLVGLYSLTSVYWIPF